MNWFASTRAAMRWTMRHRASSTLATCSLSLGLVVACAHPRPTPVGTRRPEPVAPVMTPVVTAAAPTLTEVVRQLSDSAIGAPMWRNARWGMLIIDATSGDTLAQYDADRLFMPASNEKLLTAAIAVQQLGLDYRWRTPILLRGRQRGTRWYGDVLASGRGDPSISDALRGGDALSAFDPVVVALQARGIQRIVGGVATTGDAFTGPTSGFGWAMDDADFGYGAAVDELQFNEGLLSIRVFGGVKAGAPVRIVRSPTAAYPPLEIAAVTRDSVPRGDRLRAEYDSIGRALRVVGAIGVGDSAIIAASYRHPADAFRAAMSQRITASGIAFVHPTATQRRSIARDFKRDSSLDTLVVLESPTLRDVLPRMQKPSQNQIAELLFRTTGLHVTGDGSADSARAVGVRTLATFGIGSNDIAYRDGSGLSRHDYLTPRAVVRVLDAMRRSSAFEAYRDALPIAGIDGTIANRMRGTAAAGNARAKTGTVDKARALSGYVTTTDGHLVLFSLLCNNFTVPTREVDRVQDLLVSTIAAFRASPDGTPRGR